MALLFPDPHGPLIAIVEPIGDAKSAKLVASARANGSMPKRSSVGEVIGESLKYFGFGISPHLANLELSRDPVTEDDHHRRAVRRAALAARGASTRLARLKAQSISSGGQGEAGPTMAADAAATPKISTGT